MSKIDDLIAKMCPDGVPRVELSSLTDLLNGYSFKSNLYSLEGIRVIRITNVQKGFIDNSDSKFYPMSFKQEISKYLLKTDDLLVSLTGNVGRVAQVDDSLLPAGLNQRVASLRVNDPGKVRVRFLYHLLNSSNFEMACLGAAFGSAQANLSTEWLKKYLIPLPPLEIQEEIVAILDKFTELEVELEVELEARKKQHFHFSESLFLFNKGETKRLKIQDICRISRGTVISKDYLRDHPGEYPVYSSQTLNNGIFGYIDTFAYNFESLTWTTDGANAGSIFYHQNENFTITNVCGLLQVLDPSMVSTRFLYYLLKTEAPKHVSPGMGNPKIMAGTMGDIQIDIPSFDRQLEIVEILDKFDTLLNDISIGLPAEIKARRQQYEYYRNKLLTFKELDVA